MLYVLAGEGVGAANSRLPREVHTLAITMIDNMEYIHTMSIITTTQFVHMFHMVNYDTIHMNASLDNVYCSAKIKIA
jgi:hypothetical protein